MATCSFDYSLTCVDRIQRVHFQELAYRNPCEIHKGIDKSCRIVGNSQKVGNNLSVHPNLGLPKKWKFKGQLNKMKRLLCADTETLQDRRPKKGKSQSCQIPYFICFSFSPHFISLYPEVCLNIFFPFLVVHKVIAHLTIHGVLDVMRESLRLQLSANL